VYPGGPLRLFLFLGDSMYLLLVLKVVVAVLAKSLLLEYLKAKCVDNEPPELEDDKIIN